MRKKQPTLTVGVEEEMWLVNKSTGNLCDDWPKALLSHCQKEKPNAIVREFITSQVELISPPCDSIQDLELELSSLRHYTSETAQKSGLALMAASTHPEAYWRDQKANCDTRYQTLQNDLQTAANRMLVGGMHVHVGIADRDLRLVLANQMITFLPYILALSTSSPFWAGEDTGLNSYRLTVINGLPRSGFPPLFKSIGEYDAFLKKLVKTKVISCGRELWWDMRLSARYPTIEVRVADTCTSLKDAVAIAALIQALIHCFIREKQPKKDLQMLYRIALENRWRAQRYSILDGTLLAQDGNELKTFTSVFEALFDLLQKDAQILGTENYLEDCYQILKKGTSADKQREIYKTEKAKGKSARMALKKVKSFLLDETLRELKLPFPSAL